MSRSLTLGTAERMVAVARERAEQLGVLVSIAVVDRGGHLVAFARMNGAEIAGPTLAVDKAFTSVAHSAPTAELALLAAPGGPLFGLQANGGGRYVIFPGGVPFREKDLIVGGIGVSGATAPEDASCAEASAEWFRAMTGESRQARPPEADR
ncbi:heme-binding protein [Cryobacterium sp. Sr8]|nr:heme-binding protein [Cryobacterium sp. Sr8]